MAETFGGAMRLTANGQQITMRGKMDNDPTNIEIEDGTNDDGTVYFKYKPDAYGCDITIQASTGLNINAMVRMRGTFVVVEDDTGVIHTFGDAGFSGKAQEDRKTGEISGLKIRASRYSKTNG